MHRIIQRGEYIDDQNVKNPWNWSWCEKSKVVSIREKLPATTWNGEDSVSLMIGSTIRKVFKTYVLKLAFNILHEVFIFC